MKSRPTSQPRIPSPAPLGRRAFLQRSALLPAGFALPSGLIAACGDRSQGSSALVVDPETPFWLQGNFAPVYEELDAFDLPVRGAIPPELNGLYVRNGSNPQSGVSPHWFFGDGMIHGGRLLLSGEVGAPYQIDPNDLSTIGVQEFEGKLNTSFTAHPKIDPATGFLHFFGYWFVEPYLTYHVADPQGRIVHSEPIPVAASTMIHSFAITERDVIFWELPVLFDLAAAASGADNPFHWQPEYGARIGVMPLGGPASAIRWVGIEPCYVYHEVNAYRTGDEIVLDVCRHDFMFAGERFGEAPLAMHRWHIDTAGAELS